MQLVFLALLLTLWSGCDSDPLSREQASTCSSQINDNSYAPERIEQTMKEVARYQASTIEDPEPNWIQSAFYVGVVAAYNATGDPLYLRQATDWAQANDWQLGPRARHADDHAAGQVYLALYEIERNTDRLANTKATFDRLLSDPPRGRTLWEWCDALFMAPPVLAQLAKVTGDPSYDFLLDRMYWDAVDYLYEKESHLFYRDERFFDSGTFWSRGNGWVIASVVRVLQQEPPATVRRARYLQLFQEMAKALQRLQQDDGLWRSDLLRPHRFPNPETSGSAFFTYALAWGLNKCILPAKQYEPVVRRAWSGLVESIFPDGRLGWVQPPSSAPSVAYASDTYPYGSGALLLAGSEMLRWGQN